MNQIKQFFSYDFLFGINRVRLETVDYIFGGLVLAWLIAAIVFRIMAWRTKHAVCHKLIMRWYRWSATIGLLGLLWCGARFEYIRWFGTHAAFLILVIVAIVWKAYILRYWFGSYKTEKAAWEHEQQKQKYLQKKY
jgi:hypothetical protein